MKKTEIFRGVGTALITPFKDDAIDFDALEILIERQIEANIDALVIGGTTAEAATLSDIERYELFKKSKDIVGGRCKIIFGTGTNDTRVAVKHTEFASHLGCDGVLVVTPYYNKGTGVGIVKHYERIAEASEVPILLYNVPSRTGVNLSIDTLIRLGENEKIVGIKEASDSLDRLMHISSVKGLALYSGNDSQIYPTLALGGLGVISVISNLYPKETMDICKYYFANDRDKSLSLQKDMLAVIESMFLETNPAPIKYALSKKGLCKEEMRLPMYPPADGVMTKIDRAISEYETLIQT